MRVVTARNCGRRRLGSSGTACILALSALGTSRGFQTSTGGVQWGRGRLLMPRSVAVASTAPARGSVSMGLPLWGKNRDGSRKASYSYYAHDEVLYRDRQGERLSIPQAERYSSRDWLHNLITMPSSIILNRIKVPIFWQMAWAFVVALVHRLTNFSGLSMKPATLVGSALGLLLVFRTNAAYQRFWEGRKIWEDLLNLTRDMARMCVLYGDVIGPCGVLRICNLLCAFPVLLQEHLQGFKHPAVWSALVEAGEVEELSTTHANRPLLITNKLAREVRRVPYGEDWTSRERLALLTTVAKLSNCIGACERLVQTPVPLHYVRHTSRFLTIWCFMLPLMVVSEMGFATVPCMALVSWALFGIQEIGLLIEDPFQRTLKLEIICNTIYADVHDTLGESDKALARVERFEANPTYGYDSSRALKANTDGGDRDRDMKDAGEPVRRQQLSSRRQRRPLWKYL